MLSKGSGEDSKNESWRWRSCCFCSCKSRIGQAEANARLGPGTAEQLWTGSTEPICTVAIVTRTSCALMRHSNTQPVTISRLPAKQTLVHVREPHGVWRQAIKSGHRRKRRWKIREGQFVALEAQWIETLSWNATDLHSYSCQVELCSVMFVHSGFCNGWFFFFFFQFCFSCWNWIAAAGEEEQKVSLTAFLVLFFFFFYQPASRPSVSHPGYCGVFSRLDILFKQTKKPKKTFARTFVPL